MIEVCLPGRNVTLGSDLAKKKRREKARVPQTPPPRAIG